VLILLIRLCENRRLCYIDAIRRFEDVGDEADGLHGFLPRVLRHTESMDLGTLSTFLTCSSKYSCTVIITLVGTRYDHGLCDSS
jgi:hypothetical protein